MRALTSLFLVTALPLTLLAGGGRGDEKPGPAPEDTTDTTMQGDTAMQGDTVDTMMQGDTMGNRDMHGGMGSGKTGTQVWNFSMWDRKGDGAIDSTEFRQQFSRLGLQQQLGLDTTGTLDTTQLKGAAFSLFDMNGDSTIDSTEFSQQATVWLAGEAASANGEQYGNSGDAQSMQDTATAKLSELDNNGDKQLSMEEFNSGLDVQKLLSDANVEVQDDGTIDAKELSSVIFSVSDLNSDGRITQSEWQQVSPAWRAWYNRTQGTSPPPAS